MKACSPFGPLLVALVSCASSAPPTASAPAPLPCPQPTTASAVEDARTGIDRFNEAMIEATKRMDNAATLALWEDDGVSLLPSTKPIVGKKAIRAMFDQVTAALPGAHMRSFEMTCTGLDVAADLATEYCDEHQVVDLGGGKPPFDGTGKMLFVLHRGADGKWRAQREMWNQGAEAGKADKN